MFLISKASMTINGGTYYGITAPEDQTTFDYRLIIFCSGALILGIIIGILVIVRRIAKRKKNDINNAQALYGPPEKFKKKSIVEPPEDLYGCPRPDIMDEEEPTDVE